MASFYHGLEEKPYEDKVEPQNPRDPLSPHSTQEAEGLSPGAFRGSLAR